MWCVCGVRVCVSHWCARRTSRNIHRELRAGLSRGGAEVPAGFARTAQTLTDEAAAENTGRSFWGVKNGHYALIPTAPSHPSQGLFTVRLLAAIAATSRTERCGCGLVFTDAADAPGQGPPEPRRTEGCRLYTKACNGSAPTTHPLGMKVLYP